VAGAKATAALISNDDVAKTDAYVKIAMAQAEAGDVAGGKATAALISNDVAKTQAYVNIAMAQAEAGDVAGGIDLMVSVTNRPLDKCLWLAKVADRLCPTPPRPTAEVAQSHTTADEPARPSDGTPVAVESPTPTAHEYAKKPVYQETPQLHAETGKSEERGLARAGYTKDACLICFSPRTATARNAYSDRHGFGLCEHCGQGIRNMQQLNALSQRGVEPPAEMMMAAQQFGQFMSTCFSRDDSEVRRGLIMMMVTSFASPEWDALTGGE
jgi:hypothetical protein